MSSLTYQRVANASWLLGIAAAIAIPDALFGLFIGLSHTLWELAHLLFEVIEATLDHFVEHIFETDTHETQVIVFYSMSAMASIGLYFLMRTTYCFFLTLKKNMTLAWMENITRLLNYWAESALNKFKLIAMFNVGLISCYIAFSVFV